MRHSTSQFRKRRRVRVQGLVIQSPQIKYARITVGRKGRAALFEELLGDEVIVHEALHHVDENGKIWHFCLGWKPRSDGELNEGLLRCCSTRPLAIDIAMAQRTHHGEIISLGKAGRKRALIVLERYVFSVLLRLIRIYDH